MQAPSDVPAAAQGILKPCTPPIGAGRSRYFKRIATDRAGDIAKLRKLRGVHAGRRAFIIGNGPSLNSVDLRHLRGEITFAVNSAYKLYPKMGFEATYTCLTDRVRWAELRKEVLQASSRSQFFYCDDREWPTPPELFDAAERPRVILLDQLLRVPSWCVKAIPFRNRAGFYTYRRLRREAFSWDVERGVCLGCSVIFTAAQIAAYLGCNPIILLGVDMDYSGPTAHFHGQQMWTPPMDYDRDAKPYFTLFRDAMERRGVRFLNATAGGRVDVLERVSYDTLFDAESLAKVEDALSNHEAST